MATATKSRSSKSAASKPARARKRVSKGKGTAKTGKAAAAKKTGGGNAAKLDDAVKAVCKEIKGGRKNRAELKAKVEFSNYTLLTRTLVEKGFAKEEKHEDDSVVHYVATAAGKRHASAK